MNYCGIIVTLKTRDMNRAQWRYLWRLVRVSKREADRKMESAMRDFLTYGTAAIQ